MPATASTMIQSRSSAEVLAVVGRARGPKRPPMIERGSAAAINRKKGERLDTAYSYRSRRSAGGVCEAAEAHPEDRDADAPAEQAPEPVGQE